MGMAEKFVNRYSGIGLSGMIRAGFFLRKRNGCAEGSASAGYTEGAGVVSEENRTGTLTAEQGITWPILLTGALLLALIGTWLVWFFSTTQHRIAEEEVRAACQRVMPETAERCFDTVVLQRGGVRR